MVIDIKIDIESDVENYINIICFDIESGKTLFT